MLLCFDDPSTSLNQSNDSVLTHIKLDQGVHMSCLFVCIKQFIVIFIKCVKEVWNHMNYISKHSVNHNVHILVIKIISSHHTVQTVVLGASKLTVNDGEIGPLPEIRM